MALYGGGVAVYTTRFPESKFPGKFDLLVRIPPALPAVPS